MLMFGIHVEVLGERRQERVEIASEDDVIFGKHSLQLNQSFFQLLNLRPVLLFLRAEMRRNEDIVVKANESTSLSPVKIIPLFFGQLTEDYLDIFPL